MDLIGCSSNTHQGESSGGSRDANENSSIGKEDYVNHAEIAWNQMRKEWVGDQSKKIQRPPEVSTICKPVHVANCPSLALSTNSTTLGFIKGSLTASSEEMIFSGDRIRPPIPLAAMVDYFVKIWDEEGLFEIANRFCSKKVYN